MQWHGKNPGHHGILGYPYFMGYISVVFQHRFFPKWFWSHPITIFQARFMLAEAEPLFRRALMGRQMKLGPKHPDTLEVMNNLAKLLQVWVALCCGSKI